ncbi:cyclic lactone autoinducer peptide [Clostridium sp.]|nr:cyclic lactone autoinducer peptide [Clostridium sp.]
MKKKLIYGIGALSMIMATMMASGATFFIFHQPEQPKNL